MAGSPFAGLLIATLGGAAVGLERQWSGHAAGPNARFAGIRTFTMLGFTGGFAGWLQSLHLPAASAVVLAGAIGLTIAAYVAASRHEIDATTEVAALVVIAAGMMAGLGAYPLASGIIALTCLLLLEKSRLHAWVARLDDVGLRAGGRFAVMALVVLPLLPEGPFGPFGGVKPRELWALVLFFSGLSFLGYVARRAAGPHQGQLIAGLAGGLVSSTNVTFTFARSSATHPESARALAFGTVAANAMLYPRVLVAVGVLNPELLPFAAPYLVAPFVVASAAAVYGLRHRDGALRASDVENPLQLVKALQMAVLFQAVLMIVHLAGSAWGQAGVVSSAAALGLTDVDVLTVSMTKAAATVTSPSTAALAIAVGVLSNTALKLLLALVFGYARFRAIAGGALAVLLAASAVSIIVILRA